MGTLKVPLNIPNILSLFRLALVPFAVWMAVTRHYIIALILFVVACVTDLLDGYIARKYNMISQAGIVLDPLADKLMAVSMAVVFSIQQIYPTWVSVVIFVKEAIMIGAGIYLLIRQVALPANKFGKIAGFTFNLALAVTFLHEHFPWYLHLMYVALALMVIALLQYAYFNLYKKYILVKKGESK